MQSVRDLKAWGKEIAAEFAKQHQALLQGRALTTVEGDDPLYDEIASVFEKLTLDYPAVESTGSKFIDSHFTLNPRLNVRVADFQKLYRGETLFLDEVGLVLTIEPIHNDIFGAITNEATKLTLKNIKCVSDECKTKPAPKQTNNVATIMSEVDMRPNDPRLKTWQIVADVSFGKFYSGSLELQTRGPAETAAFVITLPPQEAQIDPDGTVTLPNGSTFSMEALLGDNPVCWVSHTHTEDLDIEVSL